MARGKRHTNPIELTPIIVSFIKKEKHQLINIIAQRFEKTCIALQSLGLEHRVGFRVGHNYGGIEVRVPGRCV